MLKKRIINKNAITIITVILYIVAMLAFELLYCNASNFNNYLQGQEINYNLSICRIVMYIIFLILYFVFKNKWIEEAIKVSENKYKRILIYLSILVTLVAIIGTIVVIFNKPVITRAMSIVLITISMGTVFIIYVSNHAIKNIILTTCTIGVVFSITTNFNHALDEKKHFMSAFNVAFLNFDYVENPITDKQIEELPQLSKFTTIDEFLKGGYKPEITSDVNKEDVPSTPALYNPFLYIFSGVGIWIAKTLQGSIVDLYIMGRVFNLILYTILICIAMKLIPYKKNIFMVIFLLPMTMLLAASYSIDGICIGVVAVFIAYCLKIKKEKQTISLRDFLILCGLFIIMLLAKSMAYILVGCIVFLLPIKETLKKNKKYWPIIIVTTLIGIIICGALILYVKNTHVTSDTRGQGKIDVTEQLNHMVQNPIFSIKLIITHIGDTLLNFSWIQALHQDVFFTSSANCIMVLLFLFILYVSVTEDDYNFRITDKLIMFITFMLVYFMTSVVLYLSFTAVGATYIAGYQTRYILPILPLLLFSISSPKMVVKSSEYRNMNIAIIIGGFMIIGMAQSIIV